MEYNKESDIIVSFISGISEGKSTTISSLWSINSNCTDNYLIKEDVPGRGILSYRVCELPNVIYSLCDEWLDNTDNITAIKKTDVVVFIVPSLSFGYEDEFIFLKKIQAINPQMTIIIGVNKADRVFSKGICRKESVEKLFEIERTIVDSCSYLDDVHKLGIDDIVVYSSRKKWNLNSLKERIWNKVISISNNCIFKNELPTVVIMGKRGCGKSTTLNKLFNLDLPIRMATACTKYPRVIHIKASKGDNSVLEFNLVDLPGIAESINADMIYSDFYKQYLDCASILLCLSQADTRAYKQDELFYSYLIDKGYIHTNTRIVLGINQVDLLFKTMDNPDGIVLNDFEKNSSLIKEKIKDYFDIYSNVFKNFPGMVQENVIPFSAIQEWNMENLRDIIINNI